MKKLLLSLLLFTTAAFGQDVVDFAHVQHVPLVSYAITVEEARQMEEELKPIVQEYLDALNMPSPRLRWTLYVLDELNLQTPALVTYWSSGQQWVAIFNFKYSAMKGLTEIGKRVIIAHEVGHLTGKCMVLTTIELQEICADVISAELTSPAQVLAVLRYYRPRYPMNDILTERIEVMENLVQLHQLRESNESNME